MSQRIIETYGSLRRAFSALEFRYLHDSAQQSKRLERGLSVVGESPLDVDEDLVKLQAALHLRYLDIPALNIPRDDMKFFLEDDNFERLLRSPVDELIATCRKAVNTYVQLYRQLSGYDLVVGISAADALSSEAARAICFGNRSWRDLAAHVDELMPSFTKDEDMRSVCSKAFLQAQAQAELSIQDNDVAERAKFMFAQLQLISSFKESNGSRQQLILRTLRNVLAPDPARDMATTNAVLANSPTIASTAMKIINETGRARDAMVEAISPTAKRLIHGCERRLLRANQFLDRMIEILVEPDKTYSSSSFSSHAVKSAYMARQINSGVYLPDVLDVLSHDTARAAEFKTCVIASGLLDEAVVDENPADIAKICSQVDDVLRDMLAAGDLAITQPKIGLV